MKITAILTTFNRADFAYEALESILKQKRQADEILVIDDGSTDDTEKRLAPLLHDIRYICQENRGISAARNTGIDNASHDWIAFLDSDDLWHRKKLLRQEQKLEQHPDYRICYTDEEWRKHGKWMNQKKIHQKYSGYIYEKCLPLCIISPSSVIIHRSVLDNYGKFDEYLPACEDYDLWLRISAQIPVLYMPERLIVKQAGDWPQLSQQHSLDKYRIIALDKILKNGILSTEQSTATQKMLEYKCRIYKLGCIKHNREHDVEWVTGIQNQNNLKE